MSGDPEAIAILKKQRAELEAQVTTRFDEIVTALDGARPEEFPASAMMFGTLVEALFGDEDDPQRITFDMRLAANRLKWLEGIDIAGAKAEIAQRGRSSPRRRKGRR